MYLLTKCGKELVFGNLVLINLVHTKTDIKAGSQPRLDGTATGFSTFPATLSLPFLSSLPTQAIESLFIFSLSATPSIPPAPSPAISGSVSPLL